MSKLFGDGRLRIVGEQGEEVAKRFLDQWYQGVKDVRSDPYWQQRDVDFIVDQHLKIEVKTDNHIGNSGNFNFEVLRIQHFSEPCAYLGWSVFSEATHFIVYCPPTEQIFTCKAEDAREGMQRYTVDTAGKIRLTSIASDSERTTINVLVPMRYIPHSVYINPDGYWHKAQKAI